MEDKIQEKVSDQGLYELLPKGFFLSGSACDRFRQKREDHAEPALLQTAWEKKQPQAGWIFRLGPGIFETVNRWAGLRHPLVALR